MVRSDGWSAVLAAADEQWGLVTKQQVDGAGVAWSTLARQVRRGGVDRVAHGVYRVRGAGGVEHLELKAAWLQLAPAIPVWERQPTDGVVSHRSAAAVYGLGYLPAEVHEFGLPDRRQTRRGEVRLHRMRICDSDWDTRGGLPVTVPHRIAADLLAEREDPEAVGHVVADALRAADADPASVANAIAPYAAAHGLGTGDGLGLLGWLLELTGDSDREGWLAEASADPAGRGGQVA